MEINYSKLKIKLISFIYSCIFTLTIKYQRYKRISDLVYKVTLNNLTYGMLAVCSIEPLFLGLTVLSFDFNDKRLQKRHPGLI